ncbi:MAG: DUF3090 family protein [Chloroflexi bacterium]|nr:DUF3090 family protein [Chloroflexota bacterium]
MASAMYELNPVSRITVGTIGRPGQRLFLLQASSVDETLTLKLEKEQVFALARGIDELLEQLEQQEQISGTSVDEPPDEELELGEPIEPAFSVAQMGLAFDGAVGMMVLVLAEGLEIETEGAATARLWATPAQMRALSRHARDLVAAGRPTCPLCGRPMEPGHACPRGNGHGQRVLEEG